VRQDGEGARLAVRDSGYRGGCGPAEDGGRAGDSGPSEADSRWVTKLEINAKQSGKARKIDREFALDR
jgi:hypothetical protein